MTVATIGAFTINQYPEAVAVMLFYEIGETIQGYAVVDHNSQNIRNASAAVWEMVETDAMEAAKHLQTLTGDAYTAAFDKAALLAKKALMRSVDSSNPDPFYADLEKEMLEKVNELGIGPQGFGGKTTAIGLNIETMPTHIAGMPCAVNINCHVTRHKSEVI